MSVQRPIAKIVIHGGNTRVEYRGYGGDPAAPKTAPKRQTKSLTVGQKRLAMYGFFLLSVLAAAALWRMGAGAWSLLPPALCLLLIAAGLKLLASRTPQAAAYKDGDRVAETRGLRVAAALSASDRALTVEDLATCLVWTEDAVIGGLQRLEEEGRLIEDLDLDSGHWNYGLKTEDDEPGPPSHALPLAERVREVAKAEIQAEAEAEEA